MAVIDGPLEPPQSTTTNVNDAPDDPAFVNFFSSAMNMGNSSTPTVTELQNPCATDILLSRPVNMPPMVPSPQIASTANLTSASLLSLLDTSESNSNSNYVKNLVKPSSFSSLTSATYPLMVAPVSSSVPTAPSQHLQCPYGVQILQPFPPPTPPPTLTPVSASTPNYGPFVSRDKVQEALLLLVQLQSSCAKLEPYL
ncbi:mRNA-decapping enzyme-like protein [Bienertia sinuspersici]